MEQNKMSWCKKTHEAQLNKGNGSVIKKFVQHIQWKKIMLGITDDKTIANADKNAHFSPSFEHTIADRGCRTIVIPQPNSSKHCAAMLGCAMNSDKLPPYIIFQGENTPGGCIAHQPQDAGNHGHQQGSVCGVQQKAWWMRMKWSTGSTQFWHHMPQWFKVQRS